MPVIRLGPAPRTTLPRAAIPVFPTVENSMNLTTLIIQLIAGALGGNAAGTLSKKTNLGPVGNSIAGAIGGGVGAQLLSALFGLAGTAAASGVDVGSIISAFVTGGVSGGFSALAVGFLKAKMASYVPAMRPHLGGSPSLH